ncbi:MAG: sulfotransferase domain-containing protein [Chloroflexota bacterium]
MSTIYWLASYPKSGNTWMRILLTNYLRDADKAADINRLISGPIASARTIFDEFIGIESSDMTQDEIEGWRPAVYKHMAQQLASPYFMKVHDANIYTQRKEPLIPPEATGGVIYLIRNPLDVAVSFAHHSNISVAASVNRLADMSFTFSNHGQRLHLQFRQRLLAWHAHVTSWVDAPNMRLHVVRYEDMKADAVATFSKVIRFCGLDPDPDRIRKAVEFSAFERLAAQEQSGSFHEKAPQAKSFFRKGVVGSWREQLTPEMVEQLIAAHGEVMRRFGYLDEEEQIVY